jgi:histidinol-phosphate aminotransferase
MTTSNKKPFSYIAPGAPKVVKGGGVANLDLPILNLSTNESSFGASPLAVEAIKDRAAQPNRYPDPASTDLRNAIGEAFGLDPDLITCGNGSEEVIDGIARVYARPGDEILFSEYGFLQFPILAWRTGATAVKAAGDGLKTDVSNLLAAVTEKTKLVLVANPDNPTGTYIPAAEMKRLRDNLPSHVVLVVDSAYCEYVDDPAFTDGLELVAGHDNVIVTRTFSKAWGLAGLRVGWGYGPASMISALNLMRGIGNVNAMAQAGAVAALKDPAHVDMVRTKTDEARNKFEADLKQFGVVAVPGAANFVLVKFPTEDTNRRAIDAHRHLAAENIYVRSNEDYGLDDYLRITVGTIQECDRVIESLQRFFTD